MSLFLLAAKKKAIIVHSSDLTATHTVSGATVCSLIELSGILFRDLNHAGNFKIGRQAQGVWLI